MAELGIYIHLPFCLSRCGYCDFAVVTGQEDSQNEYVSRIKNEIEFWSGEIEQPLSSIYFGGGTPSRLTPESWRSIFGYLHQSFRLDDPIEISCEANPESAKSEVLSLWKELGVKRVSLGVQSFQENHLKNLDRQHDPAEARDAIRRIKEANFESWSLDLIYGLPGQTLAEWRHDLEISLSLDPPHLSFYNLILHPGHPVTVKANEAATPDSEEIQSEMFLFACERLERSGFQVYELSNASKAGRESRHNLLYWRGGEWIGMGMSGSSYYNGHYFHNPKIWQVYMNTWDHVPGEFPLNRKKAGWEARLLDMVMLRLRTQLGLSIADLEGFFKQELPESFTLLLHDLRNHGYTRPYEDRISLTPKGWLVHSEVTTRVLECLLKEKSIGTDLPEFDSDAGSKN